MEPQQFITVLPKSRHQTLSQSIPFQCPPTHWLPVRPRFILSSHLRQALPSGPFPTYLFHIIIGVTCTSLNIRNYILPWGCKWSCVRFTNLLKLWRSKPGVRMPARPDERWTTELDIWLLIWFMISRMVLINRLFRHSIPRINCLFN
jgi:hypothetical protein